MSTNIGDSFIGKPHPAQGSHGDIQLRIDDSPKAFFKLADTWYENVLFPAGDGIFSGNIGLEVKHKSKSVASFGSKIRLGRIANNTSRVELDQAGDLSVINRSGSTDTTKLSIDGSAGTITVKDINLTGKIVVTSTGSQNVIMGKWAATNPDVSGVNNNVILGIEAGRSFTSGAINNVMIGTDAGYSNNGDYNIHIGYQAGYYSTASSNTYLGLQAGKGTASSGGNENSGTGNTAIGYLALSAIRAGSNNVAIGLNSAVAVFSGNNNVVIGAGADAETDGTATNEIVIGYSATGQGDNIAVIGSASVTDFYAAQDKGAKVWCTNIDSSSDIRIKKNVEKATLGLEFINRLNPVKYNWRKAEDWDDDLKKRQTWYRKGKEPRDIDDTESRIGFIAQEVKTALGDVECDIHIVGENDGVHSLDYAKFVAPLTKAVQELSAKIDTMQQEINELKE